MHVMPNVTTAGPADALAATPLPDLGLPATRALQASKAIARRRFTPVGARPNATIPFGAAEERYLTGSGTELRGRFGSFKSSNR